MLERIRVFSGNANIALAKKICDKLGVSIGKAMSPLSVTEKHVSKLMKMSGVWMFSLSSPLARL